MERIIISFLRHSAIAPAHYQLGMWRVQYLQQRCCVCYLNKADFLSNNHRNKSLTRYFNKFAALICHSCHNDLTWLPTKLTLSLSSTHSSNFMPELQAVSQANPVNIQTTHAHHSLDVQSAVNHVSYIRAALIAFKYNEDVRALPVLVHAIQQLECPPECHAGNSVILATPTTVNRLRSRGFNPIKILAYYLSKHWNIPIWDGVSRINDSMKQQGLGRHERQLNIQNAFQLISSPPVSHVLLFDDVVTTGATLSELALTLKNYDSELNLSAHTITCKK